LRFTSSPKAAVADVGADANADADGIKGRRRTQSL